MDIEKKERNEKQLQLKSVFFSEYKNFLANQHELDRRLSIEGWKMNQLKRQQQLIDRKIIEQAGIIKRLREMKKTKVE